MYVCARAYVCVCLCARARVCVYVCVFERERERDRERQRDRERVFTFVVVVAARFDQNGVRQTSVNRLATRLYSLLLSTLSQQVISTLTYFHEVRTAANAS